MFFINFYATIAQFLIRTRVKYPETLKGNNFKIPRPNFFKFGTVGTLEWMKGLLYQF
jgi:hypothetical protein